LDQHPSDSEILRFSDQFTPDMMYDLILNLHITDKEWKDMEHDHPHNIAVVKFLIMRKWRENNGIFRHLAAALKQMNVTTHKLCQVGTRSLNKV